MFMYHPNTKDIGVGNRYSKGWLGKNTPSAGEVAKIITKYTASNCLWAGGIRSKSNFRIAEWLGLDFDEGTTIDEAKEKFAKYIHVIGTTKSHRKEKNGIVCDRFRVFLKFDRRCDSKDDYEFTCKKWVNRHKADRACVDAARFFWPCVEIVSLNYMGSLVKVLDSKKEIENKKKTREKREITSPGKTIPPSFQNKLKYGCSNRNIACFVMGIELTESGFSEEEIISMIKKSPIISQGFSLEEAKGAVRNGIKRACQTQTKNVR